VKTVVIASSSKNPVKLHAAQEGFRLMFPEEQFDFHLVPVSSDVPDQPIGDMQTYEGAVNRVNNAAKEFPHADYYVGMEGGIESQSQETQAFAWIIVLHEGLIGKARTGTFTLPKEITKYLHEGLEFGEASDIVFSKENSKQSSGTVGILTNGIIDRTEYYKHALVLALIPFRNPSLY
jgi:inosine/xanthosine triphosphatase